MNALTSYSLYKHVWMNTSGGCWCALCTAGCSSLFFQFTDVKHEGSPTCHCIITVHYIFDLLTGESVGVFTIFIRCECDFDHLKRKCSNDNNNSDHLLTDIEASRVTLSIMHISFFRLRFTCGQNVPTKTVRIHYHWSIKSLNILEAVKQVQFW